MSSDSLNFLFVIPTLGHGGAQRVVTDITRSLIDSGKFNEQCSFTVLTFRKETNPIHQPHSSVQLEHIDVLAGKTTAATRLVGTPLKLRKAIKRINPSAIISFQDIANFPVLIASIGLGIPVIVSERNDPEFYSMAKLRSLFRQLLYPLAAKVVVQTEKIAEQMPSSISQRLVLIPNAIPSTSQRAFTAKSHNSTYTIVNVGRLENQKDQALLIDAFAKLDNDKWSLRIYGEGSLRSKLEDHLISHNLERSASIEPATSSIFETLAQAHLFVLSSEHEGFPNVLAEAIAVGLPTIGFESASGVSDLIMDEKNGLVLTENQRNADDLSDAMNKLMEDPKKRSAMSDECPEIAARYLPEKIFDQWYQLIIKSQKC